MEDTSDQVPLRKDHAAVSAATAKAVLASATEREDGNAPPWRPDDEYASEALFDVISSRSAHLGPGKDGQRLLTCNPSSTLDRAGGVRKGHDNLLAENRRRAGRAAARVLTALLAVEPHRTGGKLPAVCVGMAWRRLTTAGAMRQWQPRLEEVNRELEEVNRELKPGGVDHVSLRARTLHETGSWPVLTDKFQRLQHR